MLDVRHYIDVMHVEKNVCDSLIGTLLNIKRKTKDTLNSHLDLLEMGIRERLAPHSVGKRTYLPPACYNLSKKEKKSLCHCLRGIKVPQGFSSNIKTLVSMKELKLVGMKSYDCHVLMQHLLPIAIRGILPKKVRDTITQLCIFFHKVCSKVLEVDKLDELECEANLILCKLEMYFPPSFFDIMVHLIVHLVREIKICGPVYLRWMYPIERYMKILKGYVKNPRRPEASIVERYIAEEAIEFCTEYLSEVRSIGLPNYRHDMRSTGKGTRGINVKSIGRAEVLQAHLYILNNTDEVLPYLSSHKNMLKENNPRMNEKSLLNEHNKTFLKWFENAILNDETASETLRWLAHGPNFDVICWSGYDINNFCFYTEHLDSKSAVQNSGVMVEAESLHFSSSKDKCPVLASVSYFGVIQEIWEIDYNKFRVPVFKCNWVDINSGIQVDEFGYTTVNLNSLAYKNEPFIMASQARQVFYVTDPSNNSLSVVLQSKPMSSKDELQPSTLELIDDVSFSLNCPTSTEDNEVDDVYATRYDHDEGIWENN